MTGGGAMYLVPLDQRPPWRPAAIAAAKQAVYEGVRAGVATIGLPARSAGIIAGSPDAAVLGDAAARGFVTVRTVGAADDGECDAPYWKVVVRYNPHGDAALNARQMRVVSRLAGDPTRCHARMMCDLVVPPTQQQIACGVRAYGRDLLPGLTARAMTQLLECGVDPDVWVIEGFERAEDYMHVVATARAGTKMAGCLIRAAGHSSGTTQELMRIGLSVPGVEGVILPRASFWEPTAAWMFARTSRASAVSMVAAEFSGWVGVLASVFSPAAEAVAI